MKEKLFLVSVMAILAVASASAQSVGIFEENPSWEEHFDSIGYPSSEHWDISQTKTGQHLATYVKNLQNVYVKNGFLHLTLRKDSTGYTSGRIMSKRKFSGGKFVFCAKLPVTKGIWNAVWMRDMSKEACRGEIDVLEHIGCWGTNKYQLNFHLWGTFDGKSNNHQRNQRYPQIDVSEFHVYTLEWYEDHFEAFVDGESVCRFSKDEVVEWPFNHEYQLIVALAYGGNWAGNCGLDDDALPQTLLVDWIKYYEFKQQ